MLEFGESLLLLRCSVRGALQDVPAPLPAAAFAALRISPTPSCWGLLTTCARLQTSITGRRNMQNMQKWRSWPGVEELAWNSQAEGQKAEVSQKSTVEPHLQTSPTFQDWQHTLMHRTKHTLAPHCLEQEPHPSRPHSTTPAAGRAGRVTGIAKGWQGPATSLASPHLALALSLGLTRLHCQKQCKFWNGKESRKEEWHTNTLSWESLAEAVTLH